MKTVVRRNRRRVIPSQECKFFKKENGQEHCFFGDQEKEEFFQNKVQRKCDKCEEEEKKKVQRTADKKEDQDKKLQRKETSVTPSHNISSFVGSLNSKGSALPKATQLFFGQRMGYDFSNVKVHNTQEASESAKAINAKAYTINNHIVFKEGQFNPETYKGRKLLAHELTHVIQQQSGEIRRQVDEQIDGDALGSVYVTGSGSSMANKINYGTSVSVQGHTVANYDHGNYSTAGLHTVRAQGCSDCGETPCAKVTGIMVSVFHANPAVTLPSVPPGLTPCQVQRVQNFITNTLSPHEQQHVTAFNNYNGLVNTPFTFTGCNSSDALGSYLQPIHDAIDAQRLAAANALSDALDPFNGTIDIDCQEPDAGHQ